MAKREQHRRFELLAEMQRLAREQRRHELGRSCAQTNASVAAEERSRSEREADVSALEATFAAPRLCIDRLALAARQLHSSDAALAEAGKTAQAARQAEDAARASLHRADQRVRLVGAIARRLRRKRADKRESEAILQTLAVNASRGDGQ